MLRFAYFLKKGDKWINIGEGVTGRNVTSVSTNVTSIADHPVSNEQFLFQLQQIALLFSG